MKGTKFLITKLLNCKFPYLNHYTVHNAKKIKNTTYFLMNYFLNCMFSAKKPTNLGRRSKGLGLKGGLGKGTL